MRVGQNPAKSINKVQQPQDITVAMVTYIPFLSGFYAQSLDVLRICLESLWSSIDMPADLLVFDNGSCPEVRAYLEGAQEQEHIQYLVLSDKNLGKGGAWNFIFQAAPGEYIAYADSDVLFSPGWLSDSLEILHAFPKAGMVTARPMRTPEAFYTSTLAWAQQTPDVTIENGKFIPWEVYRQHVLSLGTSETQAREWYESRSDWRLTRNKVQALIGAAHFQFTARKSILDEFIPFNMDRPMGQVRSLDEQLNTAGYLRLTTTEPLVKHMGNQAEGLADDRSVQVSRSQPKRLVDRPFIRKPLLWIYDAIFRLYH
jgi:glycosyltransferase involved in cell wall biosynthesis